MLIIIVGIYGLYRLANQDAPVQVNVDAPVQTPPKDESTSKSVILSEEIKRRLYVADIVADGVMIPDVFTLKVGQPVRLEINPKVDVSGCMNTILISELFDPFPDDAPLVEKDKQIVMEFTPKKIGTYYLTCVMGVPWGTIEVKG